MKRRQTQQKKAIFEVIQGKGKHMSAEDVKAILDEKEMGIGLATVYRNLNLLCEEGAIQKITHKNFSFFDGNPIPHDHFRCIRCDCVQDVEAEYHDELDQQVAKGMGAKILHHSTTFEGICPNCMKEEENRQWN
ncbi:MAG: transcriptional repressor [Solobacterium sp.]|nr:transcriptional repressor [Solobacterium sp.]